MMANEVVKQKAEVVKVESGPVEPGYAYPGMSFDELASDAASIPGHELLKDDEVDLTLVGVDFLVTRVNFREGVARLPDDLWLKQNPKNTVGAYVSLELVTNPELSLVKINRARKASDVHHLDSLAQLGIEPGDSYVINDGSTGIYRQIVAHLALQGYILLPEGNVEGKKGQTVCDTIPEEWLDVLIGETKFDPSGFQTYAANVRIRCKSGLRLSRYDSEYNPDGAKTRYLA
jgi:hypothetical protein